MAPPLNGHRRTTRLTLAAAAILLAVAIAARAYAVGNPVIQIDEQFYLLVGGRMLHGALPYVDIFDRKPIGLFLIYALARLPGGSGVIAYQLIALGCAWGTALLLHAMGRRVAPAGGALAAAALYLVWIDLAGGEGGQAPVFYNLLVTGAAALGLAQTGTTRDGGGSLRRGGAAAMLLIGVALQIKYSVVFEGLFFGLVLIGRSLAAGRRAGALAVDVALWIGCALAPTLLALCAYAALGHLHEWLFANFTSILARRQEQPGAVADRIRIMAMMVAPLALVVPLRRWAGATPRDPGVRAALRFVDGWAAAALLGVVLFGTWYNHYALALFGPFALTAAPLAARWPGRVYLAALLIVGAVLGQRMLRHHAITRGSGVELRAMARAAGSFRGCAFVYDGMPAFYDVTGSCLPTTRAFPAHLQALNEVGATGIDEAAEVRRVMAGRPERVMSMQPAYREENLAARREIDRVLRTDYVELYRYAGGQHQYVLYGLRGTMAAAGRAR